MIRTLDFLGPAIDLTIQNNKIYKSYFGGLMSILFIFITLISFFALGRGILEKNNPIVTYNRVVNADEITSKNITDNNFLFAIYDQYSVQEIKEMERRFSISYDYVVFYGNGTNTGKMKIPLSKCKNDALKKWEGYFYADASLYYCFPENSTTQILGIFNQGQHTFVRLQVEYCKNNTDSSKGRIINDCIPVEDTEIYLSSKRIQMHLIIENTIMNMKNFENPGSSVALTDTVNTNPFTWTRLYILFNQIYSDTDSGYLFEDHVIQTFSAIESVNYESFYSPSTNIIFSHVIGNCRWKERYFRKYIKIQDVVAMWGGLLNVFIIFLKFVVRYVVTPEIVDIFNLNYKYLEIPETENFSKDEKNKTAFNKNIILFEKSSFFNETKSHLTNFEKEKIKLETPNMTQTNSFLVNKRVSPLISRNVINASGEISNVQPKLSFKINENELNSFLETINTKSKKNFDFKMNWCLRSFRMCCRKRQKLFNLYNLYKTTNTKLNKVISLENLAFISRYIKMLNVILLEDYHIGILKKCNIPENYLKRKKCSLNEHTEHLIEKLKTNQNYSLLDYKLYKILSGLYTKL
jgi:hypothetical protein